MPVYKIYEGDPNKFEKEFKPKSTLSAFFVLLLIFLIILISLTIFVYYKQQNSKVIQPGIYIKGIEVSGLTKDEAFEKVAKTINNQLENPVELIYKKNKYYLEVEQFDAKFDVLSSVNLAMNIAKTGNLLNDAKEYFDTATRKINIEPNFLYDSKALDEYLITLETYLPDQLIQPSYYIDDGKLIITNGTVGAGIKRDDLSKLIIDKVKKINYTQGYINIPTFDKIPDPIDVGPIHDEIYKECENAYFTTEPYAVFADVVGVDFDYDGMVQMIEENPNQEEYQTDLIYSKADVTVQDLGAEAFPDLLASFSTKYHESNKDRTTNLRLAARKINGTVVMPGEIFSYNRVVGKRTIAAGYKEAKIFQDGEVVDGLGGGICQISTTLYNAAIAANMEIEQRRNHMFVPSYVPAGKDATVAWGSTDFKFKNRRNYPIKIKASVSDGIANVKIYGLRTDSNYDKIFIDTKVRKNTDKSLVVDSYRAYERDGKIIKRDKLYTDTYKKQ